MKVKVKDVLLSREIESPYLLNDSTECVLAIDGSTTNTGIAVLTLSGDLVLTGKFTRETMRESPVRYKLRLKGHIYDLLKNYRKIVSVVYEEPCINQVTAIKNLFMLRSMVEEVLIEHEQEERFRDIKYLEISNMKWKKHYLAPLKVPNVTDTAKKLIAEKFNREFPSLIDVSQDEKDAYGIGATYIKIRDRKQLESKKQLRNFTYLMDIRGVTTDNIDAEELRSWGLAAKVPVRVMDNGIEIVTSTGRKDFDKEIKEIMSNEDKLLVMIYPCNKLGSLRLRFKLGELSNQYPYICILVWRKNRKQQVKYII